MSIARFLIRTAHRALKNRAKRLAREQRANERRQWRQRYTAYMQSEDWKALRFMKLAQAGFQCQRCGARNVTFQVHHLHYKTFGDERLSDLECLCVPCHKIADRERAAQNRRTRYTR